MERYPGAHEAKETHENYLENTPEKQEAHEAAAEKAAKAEKPQEEIEAIRESIQERAKNSEDVLNSQRVESEDAPQQTIITKEIKELAYRRIMSRTRRQLSPPSRIMSRFIHQPVVNAVSEKVAQTVGRPSGLIGSGTAAFVGTTAYYFIAKHYGYEYNFSIFLLLLTAGLVAGWVIEVIWRLIKRSTR